MQKCHDYVRFDVFFIIIMLLFFVDLEMLHNVPSLV